ncbi:MAG: ATP-binding cassette domain-containing protein [Sphingobacteriales bacterium]|nr:MAG: ATP-binding cassette domain-containing protein [Sphingobacteriales bacterium]
MPNLSPKGKEVILLSDAIIYQNQNPVLNNVNLSITEGEFVYLIGRTGTGKSSLLKTLYADLPLKTGTGIIAGFDLKRSNWRTVPYLRRKLGIVFQDFQLLMDRNVDDNLRFTLEATDWRDEKEIDERIKIVLLNVGIIQKRYAMPYQLSGGEQQRVVIARALLNNPELILADEPTGNLDPQTSEEIIRLLYSINQVAKTTVLIGTHDLVTLNKFPSRIITCKDGKLLEGNFMT